MYIDRLSFVGSGVQRVKVQLYSEAFHVVLYMDVSRGRVRSIIFIISPSGTEDELHKL